MALAQERAATLVQIADQAEFLFVDDEAFSISDEGWERMVATDGVDDVLAAAAQHLAGCEWSASGIDLRPVLAGLGLSKTAANKRAMPALYSAIEGRPHGLPLFDSIMLLGRDRTLRRIERARVRLASAR